MFGVLALISVFVRLCRSLLVFKEKWNIEYLCVIFFLMMFGYWETDDVLNLNVLCVRVCVHLCVRAYMCVCVHVWVYEHVFEHAYYRSMCVCTCMCHCVFACVHVCMNMLM